MSSPPAARLPGIAAVVSQCPFTDSIASLRAMDPLISARITALAVRDLVTARLGVKIVPYRPSRLAAKMTCPILFCVCETGSIAPSGPALRYAAMVRRGQIKLYPEGHFEIYVDDAFERVVADQLEFLDKNLKTAS